MLRLSLKIPQVCRRLSVVLLLTSAALPAAAFSQTGYVEGDVIVTFKPAATQVRAQAALKRKSLRFHRRYGWLSDRRGRETGLVRDQSKTTSQLIEELKNDPDVESVEPNYLRYPKAVPNDTRFGELWGLQNTGQTVNGTKGTSGADTKFVQAWEMARVTGQEVVVGVIDTGVDQAHPDLVPNLWTNAGEIAGNGIDDDHDGYTDDTHGYDFADHDSDPSDADEHGTHVAGTIAAVGDNATGVIGVNSRAKIMALKVSSNGDSISTSAVIEAFEYATLLKGQGVNIVALNGSYGGGGYSNTERSAIQAAGNAGIIFCAAAGNESANNDTTNTYPASYRLSNMIVVAASDQKDALASFSNYGATKVDIAAPGTNILSTKPADLTFTVGSTTYDSSVMTYSGTTNALSGTVYDCGIGNPGDFPAGVSGNIALIERGTLTFAEKATNAMAAGATAVIVYNNVSGGFLGTLGSAGNWVPVRSISRADGLAIKAALPVTAALTLSAGYQYLEGTSMATPHVTGAVAFAAMNYPDETVAERIQRILTHVDVKSALSGKVATGGRLNLLKTVDTNGNGVADWMEPSGANPPSIVTTETLPGGAVSVAYSQPMTAAGGLSPYSWSLISGFLPTGLSLSSGGVIQGTPSTSGSFSFVLRVADNLGASSTRSFTIGIAATPLAISTGDTLPAGRVAASYSATFAAIGGAPSYSWSLAAGLLPPGLTLSAAGKIAGVPTTAGDYTFDAKVTDGSLASVQKTFLLTIDPLPLAVSSASALPVGAMGVSYSASLAGTGGTAPYTWTVSSGSLPDGLTLSSAGLIAGTPSEFGDFGVTVLLTDAKARTTTKALTLTIEQFPLAITTPTPLLAGVKSLFYGKTLTATGGNGTYTWSMTGGVLPKGMKISSAGYLNGTPLEPGTFNFVATVKDSLGLAASATLQLVITPTYLKPVISAVDLGTTTVGMSYSFTPVVANYPRSFSIKNLPPGIRYSSTTGVMSGRATAAGEFNVEIKATNPGGMSDVVIAPLVVNAIPDAYIGSFTGIIGRDPAANKNLGGRLTLTTTKTGGFTARVNYGTVTKSVTGFLLDTAPHIIADVKGVPLSLTFAADTQTLTGTFGTASVSGWRSVWSSKNHPTSRLGYYSVSIELADGADDGVLTIPQGSGYAAFTVAAAGTLTVAGKTSDGNSFTSAGFLGPNGEIAVYSSLYGNLGSILGVLALAEDTNEPYVENTVAGQLTWLKPVTKTRTYAAGFGPINLSVYGKYLSSSASKGILYGLPEAGTVGLRFTDGGLAGSNTDPDVGAVNYTSTNRVVMPKSGADNPASATLALNKASGTISGSFILTEAAPKLTRRTTYQGMLVRPATGGVKAVGYFLLPQIPTAGQTISNSPILSGKVVIDQDPSSE